MEGLTVSLFHHDPKLLSQRVHLLLQPPCHGLFLLRTLSGKQLITPMTWKAYLYPSSTKILSSSVGVNLLLEPPRYMPPPSSEWPAADNPT